MYIILPLLPYFLVFGVMVWQFMLFPIQWNIHWEISVLLNRSLFFLLLWPRLFDFALLKCLNNILATSSFTPITFFFLPVVELLLPLFQQLFYVVVFSYSWIRINMVLLKYYWVKWKPIWCFLYIIFKICEYSKYFF